MVQWANVEQVTMIATFLTRGHQGVGSHLLRWQSKMDGDQVIASHIPCRDWQGVGGGLASLHLNTGGAGNLAGWSSTQVTAG